jgi:hypothetical protein
MPSISAAIFGVIWWQPIRAGRLSGRRSSPTSMTSGYSSGRAPPRRTAEAPTHCAASVPAHSCAALAADLGGRIQAAGPARDRGPLPEIRATSRPGPLAQASAAALSNEDVQPRERWAPCCSTTLGDLTFADLDTRPPFLRSQPDWRKGALTASWERCTPVLFSEYSCSSGTTSCAARTSPVESAAQFASARTACCGGHQPTHRLALGLSSVEPPSPPRCSWVLRSRWHPRSRVSQTLALSSRWSSKAEQLSRTIPASS